MLNIHAIDVHRRTLKSVEAWILHTMVCCGWCFKPVLPTRAVIGILVFFACFFTFVLRVNMSINLIAMVKPNSENNKTLVSECLVQSGNKTDHNDTDNFSKLSALPDYGARYEWNSNQQGLILAAHFWGGMITAIPGGYFAERFGPTKTVAISNVILAIVTILTPLGASWGCIALIALRLLSGLTAGVCIPALHCMVSRWVPPDEKGIFIAALSGGFGTVVTWALSGVIIANLGWKWPFYIQGASALVFCYIWVMVVADSPETHATISKEEMDYILETLGNSVGKTKVTPPYFKMFTSIPFWALVILHFGNMWGLFLMLTAGPKYMSEVLGFNLEVSGLLTALPNLTGVIFSFMFGYIGDTIRKQRWLTVTVTRKIFVTASHFIPGLLLFAMIPAGCNVTLCVILFTCSSTFNGASSITNLQNNQDLSPNYAGTIVGIIYCVGASTGFFTPMITGYLTAEHSGVKEWNLIFAIGASIYIATGIIYCIFGSGELQPWNQIVPKTVKGVDNPAFFEIPKSMQITDDTENTRL